MKNFKIALIVFLARSIHLGSSSRASDLSTARASTQLFGDAGNLLKTFYNYNIEEKGKAIKSLKNVGRVLRRFNDIGGPMFSIIVLSLGSLEAERWVLSKNHS